MTALVDPSYDPRLRSNYIRSLSLRVDGYLLYEYNYFFKEIIDLIRCHHFRKSRSAQGLVYYYLFVNNLVYSLGLRHATYNVRAEFLTGLAMSVV